MAKGQVATEFMLYTAVFMFVAIIAFVVVSDNQQAEIPYQQNTVIENIGNGFVSALTLSVMSGSGFTYNYSFPKTVFGLPYQIIFNYTKNQTLIINWAGSYQNFSYPYNLPYFDYNVTSDSCIVNGVLNSEDCSNNLILSNDGENLTITQPS